MFKKKRSMPAEEQAAHIAEPTENIGEEAQAGFEPELELDTLSFPALKQAYLTFGNIDIDSEPPESSPEDEEAPVKLSELPEDERRRYIERLAEPDDEEPEGADEAADGEEEPLPSLFTARIEAEPKKNDDEDEDCDEEITVEGELEKQKELSTELFGYIDQLANETRQAVRRHSSGAEAAAEKKRDPYNLLFNSRYDDADSILDSIAEIPMPDSYGMGELPGGVGASTARTYDFGEDKAVDSNLDKDFEKEFGDDLGSDFGDDLDEGFFTDFDDDLAD